ELKEGALLGQLLVHLLHPRYSDRIMHEDRNDKGEDDGEHRRDIVESGYLAQNIYQSRPEAEDGHDGRGEKPENRILLPQVAFPDELEGHHKEDDADHADKETNVEHIISLDLPEQIDHHGQEHLRHVISRSKGRY